METVKNYYTATRIEDGDIALYVVKVMVFCYGGETFYAMYRCPHPATPGVAAEPFFPDEIPQGSKIYGNKEQLSNIAFLLFPILIQSGAQPAPDTIMH